MDDLYPTEEEVFEICVLNATENKIDAYKWTKEIRRTGGWFCDKSKAIDPSIVLDQQSGADQGNRMKNAMSKL